MKRILNLLQHLAMPLFLAVVSADILYLYAGDGWYDPNRLIEVSEVIIMFLFVLWGFSLFIWRACHIGR